MLKMKMDDYDELMVVVVMMTITMMILSFHKPSESKLK